MERPFFSSSVTELERIKDSAVKKQDYETLKILSHELSFRTRKKANLLAQQVDAILKKPGNKITIEGVPQEIITAIENANFGKTLRFWRAYSKKLSEDISSYKHIRGLWSLIYTRWKNADDDFFVLTEKEAKDLEIVNDETSGILSYFGYRTKINSLRRGLVLIELYNAIIPKVTNYYEWGEPRTKDRFDKIRLTLKGLAFPHRNQKEFEQAVKVWDKDHDFFIENIDKYFR